MLLEVSKTECDQVHGGHGAGTIAMILAIPHLVELYNIVADFRIHGCQNLDDRSYFAQDVCGLINRLTGNNGTEKE